MLFVTVFNLVLLVFCWCSGEVGLWAKVTLTLLTIGAACLYFWSVGVMVAAECVLVAVTGVTTFGIDFLKRRIR
jgi:hypothetical protein